MRLLTTGALCVAALSAQANVIQYFAGISYSNPSQLFQTKDSEFLLGGTGSYAHLKFSGSAYNFNSHEYDSGDSYSKTYTLMPYGRIAKRINSKLVLGLDVTEPFNSNLDWGNDSFTRYAATQNLLTDVDVSPRFSYSINQQLYIGAGINLNFLTNNETNWAFPQGETTYENLINKSSSYGTGFNIGATYLINKTNFIDLVYYSKIRQNTTGTSRLGAVVSTDYLFSFNMPATTALSYVHLFNPTWLVNLKVFQSEWNANQYVRLLNTAANPPGDFVFAMKFDKSYAFQAAVRHQYNDKLGLTLAGMVDVGPEQSNLRNIMFPAYLQYFAALVADYQITTKASVELMYGQVFSYPPIHNQLMTENGPIPFTTGKVNISANVLDLKVKVKM